MGGGVRDGRPMGGGVRGDRSTGGGVRGDRSTGGGARGGRSTGGEARGGRSTGGGAMGVVAGLSTHNRWLIGTTPLLPWKSSARYQNILLQGPINFRVSPSSNERS